ncbi:hypothetical protein [Actinocrispum sp. NPDC049592]|uniref:hypothetical protein n=1 Tax=Actinocrispum sp. NPDC049592 TaxID=3154835 RepID=UPI003426292A
MTDEPADDDPAKDWLAETFPEPEPWPEPLPHDRTAPDVPAPAHSRLADGLKGAAALAAGLYVYDALTDDSGSGGDTGS